MSGENKSEIFNPIAYYAALLNPYAAFNLISDGLCRVWLSYYCCSFPSLTSSPSQSSYHLPLLSHCRNRPLDSVYPYFNVPCFFGCCLALTCVAVTLFRTYYLFEFEFGNEKERKEEKIGSTSTYLASCIIGEQGFKGVGE